MFDLPTMARIQARMDREQEAADLAREERMRIAEAAKAQTAPRRRRPKVQV